VPLWNRLLEIKDEEIQAKRYPDGYLFLKLHERLAYAFFILSCIGVFGLIPIYLSGSVEDLKDTLKPSIAKILDEEDYKYGSASFICIGLFTIIMFLILAKFYQEAITFAKGKTRLKLI
jgi:hypothetical protein